MRSCREALEEVCLRAVSKRLSERYATAIDFADEIRQILAGDGIGRAPAITVAPAVSIGPGDNPSLLVIPIVPRRPAFVRGR